MQAKTFSLARNPEFDAIVPDPADDTVARINTVVPWITKAAHRLHARLNAHEQAMAGVDDLVQTAWLELLSRDHYFDPARSRYMTFATMIVKQVFGDILRQNIEGMRQQPLMKDDEPTIDGDDPTFETFRRQESARIAKERLEGALRELDDSSHFVVTSHYGIGTTPKTVAVQAAWLVVSPSRAIGIRLDAERRLRNHVVAQTATAV
ncbi:MAG: sigma factor [Isosphaeraceae bacterium]